MKKKAIWAEMAIFMLLLVIAVSQLYGVLRYKKTGSGGGPDNFYRTDVPIDVVVFGSSHAACTVNNGLLWSEDGIASFTFSAGSQAGEGTAFFVKEAIAKNKPKVALVETFLLLGDDYDLAAFYRTALTTKFSGRYVAFASDVANKNDLDRENFENMLLRLPVIHSRYKELAKEDFEPTEEYIRGYRGSNDVVPLDSPQLTDERAELPAEVYSSVDSIIKVCNDNGVEPVFFAASYQASIENQKAQNSLRDYVEGKGCVYLDFIQDYARYGIDFGVDFRDDGHLNDRGAEKITRAISDFLEKEYEIPDRRDQEGYELWDEHVRYLSDRQFRYELEGCHDVADYLEGLSGKASDYTLVVSLSGNYRADGDEKFWPALSDFGITQDDYENGGVWVLRPGDAHYYPGDTAEFQYYEELGKTDLNIYKNSEDEFVNIRFDQDDFSAKCNGISITVFDENIGYIIDNVYVNVYDGTSVERTEL